jgi:hypothetical protein
MSKFLLNLLVQISEALVYSKIKFYSKKKFSHFRPNQPSSQPAHPDFRPSSPHGPTGHLLPPTPEPNAQGAAAGRPRAALPVDPDSSTGRKKRPHQSPFIPPLIGTIPPLQSPVTGTFNLGPLKLLQRRPLKVLTLPPCLASAL